MGNKKGSKVRRYMKSVLRLLSKPKDMYVHAMTACSTHFPYAEATMGFATPNFTTFTLPRSFSVTSASAPAPTPAPAPAPARSSMSDYDDLKRYLLRPGSVRRNSVRGGNHRLVELFADHGRKQPARLPRSCSIGRIDEDKPCEFGYDECDINVVTPQVCPRSRSYSVHGRRASRLF